jgi:sugar lactone lactonase YvrE
MSRPTRRLLICLAALAVVMPAARAADGTITTLAGTTAGYAGDGGPAAAAQLSGPQGVATAPDGATLIADTRNNAVRRVSPSGLITTIAGGSQGAGGDNGPAVDAELDAPSDVAVLGDGSVLIADAGNHRIRRIAPGGIITTIAGSTRGLSGDGGLAIAARMDSPRGLAPLPEGGFLFADTGNGRVRRVAPNGAITTVAGTVPGFAGDGGPAVAARLNAPGGVTLTGDGGYLIADTGNGRVRRVLPDGVITTATAGLAGPTDAAPLSNGGVLVSDGGSDRIRRMSPLGFVYTVSGGRRGLAGDGGPESGGLLDSPSSLVLGPAGVLVGDTGNNRVRRLSDIGALPPPEALQTIGVAPVAGSVSVRPRATPAQIALREPDLAPNVSAVDASRGTVELTVRPLDSAADAVARVSGGAFTVVQPVAATAVADLRLTGRLVCTKPKPKPKAKAPKRAAATAARRVSRRVRIKVRGRNKTSGRYAAAVANGTAWTITDRCDRTIIRVTAGTVTVRDQKRKRSVRVRAGRTYIPLAKPKAAPTRTR